MRGIFFSLALFALVAAPARADDCDRFGRALALFSAEKDDALHELNRVQSVKPEPAKDAALCRAARILGKDSVYFATASTSHSGCFDSPQAAKQFDSQASKIGGSAADLSGFYCTEEELRQPIKAKVDECIATAAGC